ncbi:putative F-box/FBD/LRR-repeat protein At4g13965 [Primulina huaijiensis]|uniref:putative F-box/FBD/LRR-repeat protein At4g13965 n=1 Tax=Primulina huaijiensis TaxID=1492673 RepID=UPI003CC776CA
MKNRSEIGEVDRISQLPDDVLVHIISRFTWREAIATSIISTRWRRLYTYITRLTFSTRHASKHKYVQENGSSKHMKEIYDFLASSKSCRFLKEFEVNVPCLKGDNVKTWLPLDLIKSKSGGLGSFAGLKSLRQLFLHSLHVDDRDVELFVSNCTALEHLSIVNSYRLKKTSLVGHSKLKHLEISSSRNVVLIEVLDMVNLVSLTCRKLQPKYSLHLNNVPKLVEFNSSDQFHLQGRVLHGILPSVLDQLTHIDIRSTDLEDICIKQPPILTNLKHLKLEIKCVHGGRRTIFYHFPTRWKCPCLQKLEIKFLWKRNHVFHDTFDELWVELDEMGLYKVKPNEHLKEVTFSGFMGYRAETSLSWCLMKEAVALKELIVELCDETPDIRQSAAALAWEHFRKITPPSVNLVII